MQPMSTSARAVGPGWLSVVTFALATIVHGMAVVAIANRFSTRLPPHAAGRAGKVRAVAPLVLPALLLVPGVYLVLLLALGMVMTLVGSQVTPLVRALRSRAAVTAGRVALAALAAVLLPGTLVALRDVIVRDPPAVQADLTERSHDAARP